MPPTKAKRMIARQIYFRGPRAPFSLHSELAIRRRSCERIARAANEFRVNPGDRGEIDEIALVRQNEIEHCGQKRGIARGLAQVLGTEPAFGKKAPEPRPVAG